MIFLFLRGYIFRWIAVLIIGLFIFEFYYFLQISKSKRYEPRVRTVSEFEGLLCSFDKLTKQVVTRKAECPREGIVTSFRHALLSSNMWQYANVLVCSKATGLDAYIPNCMKNALERVFVNISVPLLSEIGHCNISFVPSASSLEEYWEDSSQSIVIRNAELYDDAVLQNLDKVRDKFVFSPKMKDVARHWLSAAKPNGTEYVTYVGVFITRTHYIVDQEYDDLYPSIQFFVDAIEEFRKEYRNPVFIVIADQKTFWEVALGSKNVFVLEEESLEPYGTALAVLSHCNHSILASDGIALWAAILTKGKAIVSVSLSDEFRNLIEARSTWRFLENNTKTTNKFLDKLS